MGNPRDRSDAGGRLQGHPPEAPEPRSRQAGAVALRPAGAADSSTLWKWRCDQAISQWFRNPGPVPRAEHDAWLADALDRTDRLLFVGEHRGSPIGMARLDIEPEAAKTAEVSILVDPEFQGQGLGRRLLEAAVSAWWELGGLSVNATVHEANAASVRTFTAVGFTRSHGKDGPWIRFSL